MPTTDIGLNNIANLTNDEVGELTGQGILNENDLRYVESEDLPTAIETLSIATVFEPRTAARIQFNHRSNTGSK